MERRQQGKQLAIQVDLRVGPSEKDDKSANTPKVYEGVRLSEKEKEYLLPHFMMMLVGKPGSGKTSVIKKLLNEKAFYFQKFDHVLLLSPSATKMEIRVKKENMSQNFSLQWIEQRLFEFNKIQKERIVKRLRELNIIDKFELQRLNGQMGDAIANEVNKKDPTSTQVGNVMQDKERFFNPNFFKSNQIANSLMNKPKKKAMVNGQMKEVEVSLPQYVDELHQKYVLKLPIDDRNSLYSNCLIVLDDMVSQIKASEFDPLLTQLMFNRRHLLLNGMISLIVVSQKYTMIPSRVRSNSNWLVLFRLNPVDFDNVYKDVVMMNTREWSQLVDFIFGGVEKKYNNLGIWVEQDQYFMNFHRLNIQQSDGKVIAGNEIDLTLTKDQL